MHPWEDFAETWAAYLDMISALDTAAHHMGFGGHDRCRARRDRADDPAIQQLGVGLNEINRSMGLLDVVPEVFVPPVVEKLRFVHELVRQGSGENERAANRQVVAADAVAVAARTVCSRVASAQHSAGVQA